MHLDAQLEGDVLILRVDAKRIDAASAVQMKDQFRETVADHDGRVLMDLTAVDFMDSSGLGATVASMKMLNGRRLELSDLSPTVSKVFRLTRMDQIFILHDTAESALSDHQNAQTSDR